VDLLLRSCPTTRVLATSREALGISGEQAFPVAELRLPDPLAAATKGQVARSEAVQLFVARARQVAPDFDLTERNAATVASICHRLDGMPLAIELAAQQVRLLGTTGIVTRLADRLDLVTGDRTVHSRHASLQSAIEWSYHLLAPDAKAVWRRLSVLAGPFTVALATAVCGAPDEVLPLLRALESKSLVAPVPREDGSVWLRQLGSIRTYGRDQLAAAGEWDATHECLVAQLAGAIEPHLTAFILPPTACEEIATHEHHILAAVDWLAANEDDRLAVLACGLARCWMALGRNLVESRALLHDTVGRVRHRPGYTALLLAALCKAAHRQGEYAEQLRIGRQALAIERTLGRPARAASILDLLAAGWRAIGSQAMARLCYEEALDIVRGLDDPATLAIVLNDVAWAALEWSEPDLARRMLHEGLPAARVHSTPGRLASMLHTAGVLALVDGDYPLAEARFTEALTVTNPADGLKVPYFLEGLGIVLMARGAVDRGLSLIACARTVRREEHAVAEPHWQRRVDAAVETAIAEFGERRAKTATADGERISLPGAINYARKAVGHPPDAAALGQLSNQEYLVAALVTDGLTNKQIGRRLHVSARTVATHLERIRDKLGIRSRPALAAWFARESR
jgi:predicted ATPase/DNA-binding CsgD family transcriptional regulator